ncbi:hypothetical protein DDB_G0293906 [Dictyostelium discoideum AX4]|uniref:Ubiquitin-like domain-containing protein n=1 Tax=Dictyostelium discoideum TaxID=44689 RepID=Q54B55_DICDI|nr:hypothetical protein DDB_G0293906 [Dictyostelium discoideum AX4]EAL60452.1 hypothetical protein DDB_G0293906 [Dictyostelium discoideum AX4]|eukprot:XP_628861.1 hypothetical protein DDB_G0293906 [Dictyostelium discoideum AX4]
MKVHCQLPTNNNNNNETIDFEVDQDNTLLVDLKQMIYNKTGTPVNRQSIELENKKLPHRYDKKSISKLHINESSNIRVVYVLEGGCCGVGCDICGCGGSCRCSIQ